MMDSGKEMDERSVGSEDGTGKSRAVKVFEKRRAKKFAKTARQGHYSSEISVEDLRALFAGRYPEDVPKLLFNDKVAQKQGKQMLQLGDVHRAVQWVFGFGPNPGWFVVQMRPRIPLLVVVAVRGVWNEHLDSNHTSTSFLQTLPHRQMVLGRFVKNIPSVYRLIVALKPNRRRQKLSYKTPWVEVPTACLESLLLSEEDHEFHEFPRVVEGNVLMSEEEQVAEEGKEGESGGGSGGRGRVPIADGPIVPTTPTPLRAPSARVLSAFVEDAKEYWRAKENDKKGSKAKVEDEHPAKRQRVGSESHVEEPMIRVPCPACMYDLSGPGESETKEKDDKKGKQKPRGDANMDKKKVGGDSPATGGASKGEKKLPASSSPTVPVHGVGGGNLHPAVIMSTIQLKKGWKNDARASSTVLPPKPKNLPDVLALDCEMCVTDKGLELTRVSVVDWKLRIVYDTLVKPANPIRDYVTQFSGITAALLENVSTTLQDVQAALRSRITESTILVGHSVECDLKALQLSHPRVIDTSLMFPHYRGPPARYSLKSLVQHRLEVDIQRHDAPEASVGVTVEDSEAGAVALHGHDSVEDARAAMALVHAKLLQHPDFGNIPGQMAWHLPSASRSPSPAVESKSEKKERDGKEGDESQKEQVASLQPQSRKTPPWLSFSANNLQGQRPETVFHAIPRPSHMSDISFAVTSETIALHDLVPGSSFIHNPDNHDVSGTTAKVLAEAKRMGEQWAKDETRAPGCIVTELSVLPPPVKTTNGDMKQVVAEEEGRPSGPHTSARLGRLDAGLRNLAQGLPRGTTMLVFTGPGWNVDKDEKNETQKGGKGKADEKEGKEKKEDTEGKEKEKDDKPRPRPAFGRMYIHTVGAEPEKKQ